MKTRNFRIIDCIIVFIAEIMLNVFLYFVNFFTMYNPYFITSFIFTIIQLGVYLILRRIFVEKGKSVPRLFFMLWSGIFPAVFCGTLAHFLDFNQYEHSKNLELMYNNGMVFVILPAALIVLFVSLGLDLGKCIHKEKAPKAVKTAAE